MHRRITGKPVESSLREDGRHHLTVTAMDCWTTFLQPGRVDGGGHSRRDKRSIAMGEVTGIGDAEEVM